MALIPAREHGIAMSKSQGASRKLCPNNRAITEDHGVPDGGSEVGEFLEVTARLREIASIVRR
jgi:hypothetical protein